MERERKEVVISEIIELLKDEEVVTLISNEYSESMQSIEDVFSILKDRMNNVTEEEYRYAISTLKEDGKLIEKVIDEDSTLSIYDSELSIDDLEKVAGGGKIGFYFEW